MVEIGRDAIPEIGGDEMTKLEKLKKFLESEGYKKVNEGSTWASSVNEREIVVDYEEYECDEILVSIETTNED